MKTLAVLSLTFVLLFMPIVAAYGHPHIFIEASITFVFENDGLKGVRVVWLFDEMFSASIIMDFDANKNRVFEIQEINAVRLGAFSNLANFGYFLHAEIGGVKIPVKSVTDFSAGIIGGRLSYTFFVPLRVDAADGGNSACVACFDDTYFCDIRYVKKDPVRLENEAGFVCFWELVDDKKNAYWGGMIVPKKIELKFRKKDG